MVDEQHVGCCHWVTLGVDLNRIHIVLWVSLEVVSKISSLWGKIEFLVFITVIVFPIFPVISGLIVVVNGIIFVQ
jgi:hypothetical protein